MSFVVATSALTHAGVMTMLQAAVARAEEIGQPQCIGSVPACGLPRGVTRRTGAMYLCRRCARTMSRTAASIGAPSDAIPEAVRPHIAAATQNAVTGLGGGLPIRVGGVLLGGIGVGSGSAEQDIDVGRAALAAIGAEV